MFVGMVKIMLPAVKLETAFAALNTALVATGKVPLARVIDALSAAPCRVLGLEAGFLLSGGDGAKVWVAEEGS